MRDNTPMARPMFDEDAMFAALDLVGRSGAKEAEFGYLHDDVPVERAAWWAHARYEGARISVEDQRGPIEALEALARRILDGGSCSHCGRLVALSDDVEGCRWTRMGRRWARGCEAAPSRQVLRAEARAQAKRVRG